ncbi:unnamed protein product [Heligmosomoides polygyrus]|uniref:G_PROTEIN_RECEP_F1_2 domain-containing protein n=1 Tax=Heligmosomoides polygyrus TaxID=6339 RepID=A0A3P7ZTB4_HELPZ|nr:unnamed protein product [Heligmosomoides polygyrus]
MSFEQKTCCCSLNVAVVVLCSVEMATIIIGYLTNFEHPLMRCRSYNVSVGGTQRTTVTTQKRLCTTNGPLLAWLIAHLFINLGALIAIQTSRYRAIIPYISAAVVDLLVSSAYLVVLLAQLIRGEQTDPILVVFIVAIVVFKSYCVYCARRLYWQLQSVFDRRYTTRTMIIKEDSAFQF